VLARLYLSQLNADLPRDVQRIDRQAMALLSDYPWPGNYIQFKRVLSQLCIVSRDHTIRAADVRSFLSLERPVYQHGDSQPMDGELDLEQPLSRIEHDIVDIVVRRNGGNQSAAARQLGISRTTLWRMTKDQGER
jgi:transcriptional regulator with PAS, ATPase and Fis domain